MIGFTIFIEPSIKLSGIEDGKVYADHPAIHLKESFGSTHFTLNGNEINLDYTVKKNGTYILKGESTLLWKKKKVSYTFEIDDKPPLTLRIKERNKKVYFKEALFTLEKEEHVTYKAELNGKEIPVDQPIQQAGEHTLTIIATKPNGLTAKKEISFSIDERTFPQKTVDQFVDYYFMDDRYLVKKFTDKVAINLSGDYNEADVKMVQKAIEEMKAFFPYEMKIVEDLSKNLEYDRDIKMVFTPTKNFKTYTVNEDNLLGVEMPIRVSPVYGTMETLVLIGTDKDITRDYRNGVILHELLHAVGLFNHIQSPESSALYEYGNTTVTLGDKEKMHGELLYLGDIEPNSTKEMVMKQLEKRIQ